VRSIEVVEPSDISGLVVVPGEDLVSLVTCTPLGINTHRLIVEGERIADPDEDRHLLPSLPARGANSPALSCICRAIVQFDSEHDIHGVKTAPCLGAV